MRSSIFSSLLTPLWALVVLAMASHVAAVKFTVPAQHKGALPRCIRDFVTKDTLVVVNVKSSGYVGDNQALLVYVKDNKNNEYGRKKDVVGSVSIAFTSHIDAGFDVCFENVLQNHAAANLERQIELDVEIGANARDWNAVQAAERLVPTEVELLRIEELTDEIVKELDYLKLREARLRDTNESTNQRVKVFSVGIILSLLALGVWQITYLRNYFRSKHII